MRLKDFRMEYYEPGTSSSGAATGQVWRLPAEAGQTLSLGEVWARSRCSRSFENFRIDIEDDKPVAYDEPGGSNPALEVRSKSRGPRRQAICLRAHAGTRQSRMTRWMSYYRGRSRTTSASWRSSQDGKVVAAKDIEVNHPLHYGGYHFYQHSYGEDKPGDTRPAWWSPIPG